MGGMRHKILLLIVWLRGNQDWDMTHRILKIRTNLHVEVNENTFLAPVLKIEKRVEDDIRTMSEKIDSTDLAWFLK